ncbi:MAG TPA: aminoglycoside phosphotransferase family protein [Candidatus Moranbacteria bacterium]|nr:aminoglycoside phosphotransferase family protein [Candidatus Moranbacteria bacterium]
MESEQLLLDKISKEYNLPRLSFLREPRKGISTKNIIASTEDGGEYFIKRYKKADLDKIENSEKSARFISENSDIPVVSSLKNKKGELHLAISGQQYSIFPFISNEETRPNSEVERIIYTRNLGEMLGRIHLVSRKVSIPKTIKTIEAWNLDDRARSVLEYEKILKFIGEKDSPDEYDKKAKKFINLKSSLLKKNKFAKRENQPAFVCHGDYHGRNILFDGRWNIIGICDWDISGIGNPYSEFIRSFNMIVIRRDFDHIEDKKDQAKVFINGYVKECGFVFDLTKLEYAIEAWYEKLLTIQWPLTDHYYLNHNKTDSSLYSEYDKVIFLRDKRKQLLELIKSCL